MIPARHLLWVDGGAALLAGAATFALADWLSRLYRLPIELMTTIAAANILYGSFSSGLAYSTRRPRALIVVLVFANAAWAVFCCVAAAVFWAQASIFGLAHLILEGAFVAFLSRIEWLQRDRLVREVGPGARASDMRIE